MKNLGGQLDEIRKRLGISQIDLSKRSGVPIATLQRLLWGRNSSLDNIIPVATAMGYEVILEEIK